MHMRHTICCWAWP